MDHYSTGLVFKKESIALAKKRFSHSMREQRVCYYGSYLFDIKDNAYNNEDELLGEWLKDNSLLTPEEQVLVGRLKHSYHEKSYNIDLSITRIIQKQLLTPKDRVLHLYVDSRGLDVCEFITIDTDEQLSVESVSFMDLGNVIVEQEEEIKNKIIDSFYANLDLVRHFGFHLYFFPSALQFVNKVINVTTIICPDKLKSEDFFSFLGIVQYSIEGLLKDTIQYYQENAKKEAIKSAKAAIMARNMSHNLGSHVIAYLKQHLSSASSIMLDNVLSEIVSAAVYSEYDDLVYKSLKEESTFVPDLSISVRYENISLPFLVGLGGFLSYMQERQDFIATIATDYIPYYSTVNFKDFIFDELNPDKRFERHKDRGKCLKPDNILLGNIARSEGLGRQISSTEGEKLADIVIKFQHFDGNSVVNDGGNCIKGREDAFKSLDRLRHLEVSLPGGMVGRQAVFSIVENIIRNAAKHGDWQKAGKLELTFDIIEKEEVEKVGQLLGLKQNLENRLASLSEQEREDLESIKNQIKEDSVGDNLSLKEVLWLFYSRAKDSDDLLFMTITDNVKSDSQTVDRISEALREEYIDVEHEDVMKEGNKGIKELRISSAWLRGAKDESEYYNPSPLPENRISEPQNEKRAPLMYVRLSQDRDKDSENTGRLQYVFCLMVPKSVAVVSQSFKLGDEARKKAASVFWRVFSPEEFNLENKGYSFVLCDGEECMRLVRPYASSKIALIDSVDGINRDSLFEHLHQGINQDISHRIELVLYRHFSGADKKKDFICIDDKKAFAKAKEVFNRCPSMAVSYTWNDGECVRSDGKSVEKSLVMATAKYDGMRLTPGKTYYRVDNIVVTDGGGFGEYVYRTHHESRKEFELFMNDNRFSGCQFVEGISGNSSTDRLVRNDIFNERWFLAHIRAMKRKVAIFDERLFSRITGLEEASFTRARLIVGDLKKQKEGYSKLFAKHPVHVKLLNSLGSKDEIENLIFSKPLLRKELYSSIRFSKDNMAAAFYQKGIMVFTLFKEDYTMNSVGLYGIKYPSTQDVVKGFIGRDGFFAECAKLATLSWDGGLGLTIKPFDQEADSLYQCFDYISIHQGLLDKLYKAFDIKETEQKEKLTRQFYFFLKKNPPGEDTVFLPEMTVHSGRSRPNKDDMPQQLPFIQYAALEHAVLDCKYSLIELLDNARCEE